MVPFLSHGYANDVCSLVHISKEAVQRSEEERERNRDRKAQREERQNKNTDSLNHTEIRGREIFFYSKCIPFEIYI